MPRFNPILEDYKLLVVYRNIGSKLLLQLKVVMSAPPYAAYFKSLNLTDTNELYFTYLHYRFKTALEAFFDYSKMPKTAVLTTYQLREPLEPEEIVSYSFDLDYNVNTIYTLETFAEHYLIDFHQNLKKSFSENHVPFAIKLNDK